MREWSGKTYWLIGASEGLGRALAGQLSKVGVSLVLSARNQDRLQSLADELPGRARIAPCDVTDTDSVEAAAAEAGEIDGMIYTAGAYWPMSARDWDTEKALTTLDVNLAGASRALGAVLPKMIARDRGHIVLTGSLAAYRGFPAATAYGASKAGIMHLAEALHADLRGSGVEVQLANPGFVKTRMSKKNDFHMPGLMEPQDAARRMFEHMGSDNFKSGFPGGVSAMIRFGQLLPDWAWYPLTRSEK
ncbi:SDR family oxidoreductase [Tropicimonas sp. IMCC34011]|uniref:SDR family NAD(P)-dependent oxidoreductase n=1 Tax=Tropicimonas sp. IMCC34011 TaxID=2248759 RepID=UPI000E238577|nr:SDR family NAD(P)-dependent oxidoreductase [Tropicimonas sp. IMCC34011]